MPDKVGRFQLYSDTSKYATGGALLTLPSSVVLYEFYIKAGSMCLSTCYCVIDVVSTSPVVWSQMTWFFL